MNTIINKFCLKKNITYLILAWFFILIFGPYVEIFKVPVRLDHIVFPLSGMIMIAYFWFKNRQIVIPKVLFLYLCFIGITILCTFSTMFSAKYSFNLVTLIAALDNHLRPILIFCITYVIYKHASVDITKLIRGLLVASIFLSVFGYFQVSEIPVFMHKFVEKLSINWYTGRHGSKMGIPYLLMHMRAVSTFYLPGNFLLFMSMTGCFIIFGNKNLKFSKPVYTILLFFSILGVFFSGSKGFFIFLAVVITILLIQKKIFHLMLICLMLTGVCLISFHLAPYPLKIQKSYIYFDNFLDLYNRNFGPRFGYFISDKQDKILKNNRKEKKKEQLIQENPEKTTALKTNDTILKQQVIASKTVKKPVRNDQITQNVKKTTKKKELHHNFKTGNMSSALTTIASRHYFGVGYVSNVDYGDSMIVHLLVRGGITGLILYHLFVIYLAVILFKKYKKDNPLRPVALSWIIINLIFLLCGVAYPSFIQDRSGDIFWWIAAILIFHPLQNPEPVKT